MRAINELTDAGPLTGVRMRHCSMLSIVTPAYNEARNLHVLYEKLTEVLASLDLDWEWIVVDDHSADETFAVIKQIASRDSRVRGIRFARNFGSHVALTCGLHHARGDCAVVMAADLQDPPETICDLIVKWRAGAQPPTRCWGHPLETRNRHLSKIVHKI